MSDDNEIKIFIATIQKDIEYIKLQISEMSAKCRNCQPDVINQHLTEAPVNREKIAKIETNLEELTYIKRALYGTIVALTIAIVTGVLAFATTWGQLGKQVEVNTNRLLYLEEIHPRTGMNGK